MRKRIITVVVLTIATLFAGWLIDNRHGSALATDGSTRISHPQAGKDVDVYFCTCGLANTSGNSLTLVSVSPVTASEGMELVDARIFTKDDFPGGVPLTWSPSAGELYNPAKVPSVPLTGYKLGARQSMTDEMLIVRFRITTSHRPLTATGLKVTYHHGFRNHTQVVHNTFDIIRPPTTPPQNETR